MMPSIKNGSWEERADLEPDRMNYNSLCKLPFGYANEQASRENARDYNNHHLLLNMGYMAGAVWCSLHILSFDLDDSIRAFRTPVLRVRKNEAWRSGQGHTTGKKVTSRDGAQMCSSLNHRAPSFRGKRGGGVVSAVRWKWTVTAQSRQPLTSQSHALFLPVLPEPSPVDSAAVGAVFWDG